MIAKVVFTNDMIKDIFNTTPSFYEQKYISLNSDAIKQMALDALMSTYALQKAIYKAEYDRQTFEEISNKMDYNINSLYKYLLTLEDDSVKVISKELLTELTKLQLNISEIIVNHQGGDIKTLSLMQESALDKVWAGKENDAWDELYREIDV